ncbi:TPA: hypothetical protein EYP70_00555 [Candidatus Bathyarchaeota archaeon]|nr:hypothetical protein [Candidatus Bathyarchaeota archaeon]
MRKQTQKIQERYRGLSTDSGNGFKGINVSFPPLPFPVLSLPKSVPFNEFSKFPFAFGILTLLFLHGVLVFANPLVDVSLSDEQYREVYDFIDRMIAKKAINGIVKNTRPYSRGEVATVLVALAKKVEKGDVFLSNIERKRLTRLMHLFVADFKYHRAF